MAKRQIASELVRQKSPQKSQKKEKWRKDAMIKVKTLLEVETISKGNFKNKEKVINIYIEYPWGNTHSCSFPYTKKGKRQALNFIGENLYLR